MPHSAAIKEDAIKIITNLHLGLGKTNADEVSEASSLGRLFEEHALADALKCDYLHVMVFTCMFLWFCVFLLSLKFPCHWKRRGWIWTCVIISLFHCIYIYMDIDLLLLFAFCVRAIHVFWFFNLQMNFCGRTALLCLLVFQLWLRTCIIFDTDTPELIFNLSKAAVSTLPLVPVCLSRHFNLPILLLNLILVASFFLIVGEDYFIVESEFWMCIVVLLNLITFKEDPSPVLHPIEPIVLKSVAGPPKARTPQQTRFAKRQQIRDMARNLVNQNNSAYKKNQYTFPPKRPTNFPTTLPEPSVSPARKMEPFISPRRNRTRRKYVVRMLDHLFENNDMASSEDQHTAAYTRFYSEENV